MKYLTLIAAIAAAPAIAGPNENPDRWFQYLDAEIGASVMPDSSVDCMDNYSNDVDGQRHVVSRAALVANVYRHDRLTVDAKLWEHIGCRSSFDSGQAMGGPGLTVRWRIFGR